MKQTFLHLLNEILEFLTNKRFIYHLLAIMLFLFVILFGVIQWLRIYTHHGQKIEMPDFTNMQVENAIVDAKEKSFQMIVNDSVHIVGIPGGVIRLQNPPGGSYVKQKRKIYVTITKYKADKVNLAELYEIYGQNYNLKSSEFRSRGLNTIIKETRADNTDNVILEVWYEGNKIIGQEAPPDNLTVDKGSTLEFVVSSSSIGSFTIPDLIGRTVSEARFMLRNFRIGEMRDTNGNLIDDASGAIITTQFPEAGSTGTRGQVIDLRITKDPQN